MTAAPARSRRADILAAAEREFASAGYAGGRIERIAETAGVNKQLLFHYFRSKDGLFDAAVSSVLTRFEPRPHTSEHPAEEIRAIMEAVQAAAGVFPGLLDLLADAPGGFEFPVAAATQAVAWRERQHTRLRGAVDEGQRRGYFRDDIDPVSIAALALSSALGLCALPRHKHLPLSKVIADFCAWR
jgi:TetR/AcrR family transcriptional regulator